MAIYSHPTNLSYDDLFDYWTYHLHPIDSSADMFGPFSDILSLIRSRRRPGAIMTSWSDLDFYDFRKWHGSVGLVEVLPQQSDFRVRLFGTYFVECFEDELTGVLISEQPGETDASNKEDVRFYKAVCNQPGIGITFGPATWVEKQYLHYTVFYLPLAEDGMTASHVLNLIVKSSPDAPILSIGQS